MNVPLRYSYMMGRPYGKFSYLLLPFIFIVILLLSPLVLLVMLIKK